jgi:hypothetical protein
VLCWYPAEDWKGVLLMKANIVVADMQEAAPSSAIRYPVILRLWREFEARPIRRVDEFVPPEKLADRVTGVEFGLD